MIRNARWIWTGLGEATVYNCTAVATKVVPIAEFLSASVEITADSWYRLEINGIWVADGPARGWPNHYQYDRIDLSGYLSKGRNEILVYVRYFGTGTFHQVPKRPGLLASIEVVSEHGVDTYDTGCDWQIASYPALKPNTPKISIQMEPFEWFDARKPKSLDFAPAVEICGAETGPWKGLAPRSTPLLTREPRHAVRGKRNIVEPSLVTYAIPVARLLYPGSIEANHAASMAHGIATVARCDTGGPVRVTTYGYRLYMDGRWYDGGEDGFDHFIDIPVGDTLLFLVPEHAFGHLKDFSFAIDRGVVLCNPGSGATDLPLMFLRCDDLRYLDNDLARSFWFPTETMKSIAARFAERAERAAGALAQGTAVFRLEGFDPAPFSPETAPSTDPHAAFLARREVGVASVCDSTSPRIPAGTIPAAPFHDNAERYVVEPDRSGEIELCLDFGEQVCGYVEFELSATAGLEVDAFLVEYIRADGTVQHTIANRNGLRYICHEGVNHFISFKRRSGRYLFVTLRNQTSPVSIRLIRVIESIYPRVLTGNFHSSDAVLDSVWRISERTLQLCMEDTFTDCPLYEQTLWVGDARNESLFALSTYGAEDIVKRCIEVAGESLEQYPIVGSQVPTSWDTLLPAWSFLWGISVWDYYFYSGDVDFLEKMWHLVAQNIDGAMNMLDERGLFSGTHWNMFDWSGLDHEHETVIHNSMFFAGALQAAGRCARALNRSDEADSYDARHRALVSAIEATWLEDRGAYPDSIHEDGFASDSISQHNSFLSVLYDVSDGGRRTISIDRMRNPAADMVLVGSPFAVLYLYEALDIAGFGPEIVDSIYESYTPMIEDGATTVWEVFPRSDDRPSEFPTRSHVHAWSAAPLYMLPRVILGIRQTGVGGSRFEISPAPCGLQHASGTVKSKRGPVTITWRLEGNGMLIDAMVPPGVDAAFCTNRYLSDYDVTFRLNNG